MVSKAFSDLQFYSRKIYLGPYTRTLNPGDTQHFNFQDDDTGPFWTTKRMTAEKKEDKVIEGVKKWRFAFKTVSQKRKKSKKLYKGGDGDRKVCYSAFGSMDG